jgi:hypothetical protein
VWIAAHPSARAVIDQRLDGTTLYAHDARSYRAAANPGADWRDGRYAFQLRDGRIEALTFGRNASEIAAASSGTARTER